MLFDFKNPLLLIVKQATIRINNIIIIFNINIIISINRVWRWRWSLLCCFDFIMLSTAYLFVNINYPITKITVPASRSNTRGVKSLDDFISTLFQLRCIIQRRHQDRRVDESPHVNACSLENRSKIL